LLSVFDVPVLIAQPNSRPTLSPRRPMRDGFRIKAVMLEASPNWSVIFPMPRAFNGNAQAVSSVAARNGSAK
jgi:hypothetical protein